uniref:Leucine-rich repeat-containing N-terminal plant-type domain-containing protein n=1 Tax=Corethron hystrix TaxID=216773 RepID=A0A7S1FLX5_9STRA|mmetsp:Transcript_14799/g.32783  ORF Transcript_14799/g.32783 Transcript_14799/m.32783 type:complete len:730 (+) Transcript_14799:1203-3392(+)
MPPNSSRCSMTGWSWGRSSLGGDGGDGGNEMDSSDSSDCEDDDDYFINSNGKCDRTYRGRSYDSSEGYDEDGVRISYKSYGGGPSSSKEINRKMKRNNSHARVDTNTVPPTPASHLSQENPLHPHVGQKLSKHPSSPIFPSPPLYSRPLTAARHHLYQFYMETRRCRNFWEGADDIGRQYADLSIHECYLPWVYCGAVYGIDPSLSVSSVPSLSLQTNSNSRNHSVIRSLGRWTVTRIDIFGATMSQDDETKNTKIEDVTTDGKSFCVDSQLPLSHLLAINTLISLSIEKLPINMVPLGTIPAQLPLGLTSLRLRNVAGGTIPPTLVNSLPALHTLDISSNPHVVGTIPITIGQALCLQTIRLSDNDLSGTLPQEIWRLGRSLRTLDLSGNPLLGGNLTIPSWAKPGDLLEFDLSRCGFSGPLPGSLCEAASELADIDLSANAFTGTLPEKWATECANLHHLDLGKNKLAGTIPNRWGMHDAMLYLQTLTLGHNRLTGTVGSNIYGDLMHLDLSHNMLHGRVPPDEEYGYGEEGFSKDYSDDDYDSSDDTSSEEEDAAANFLRYNRLRDLLLEGNRFVGEVPPSLCPARRWGGRVPASAVGVIIYGCDGVLCPMGTYHSEGRAEEKFGPCRPCPEGQTTTYLGSSTCSLQATQRDALAMLYRTAGGEEHWDPKKRKRWGEEGVNECEWEGVTCDADGVVESLTFPVRGTHISPIKRRRMLAIREEDGWG